jgi:excisionase family DNA binding protein
MADTPLGRRAGERREAVSVQRAAILLDVHEDTIYRLIKGGKLKALRVGRSLRVLLSSLRGLQN